MKKKIKLSGIIMLMFSLACLLLAGWTISTLSHTQKIVWIALKIFAIFELILTSGFAAAVGKSFMED